MPDTTRCVVSLDLSVCPTGPAIQAALEGGVVVIAVSSANMSDGEADGAICLIVRKGRRLTTEATAEMIGSFVASCVEAVGQ